ncbi:Na+/H+ antiporter NhaD [Paenibacillus sp. 1_12]|uniref:SLC13 family permease n=1 Tax=Paenibacillus sp. 1_12 TaxID=1566278 RepID=UPI0008E7F514|nr:SLC13 family permease [Paenibacillus sp. 1_12]SFK69235.1 Na+/H+ antiporter NhaD [Paenibacillus sp. 1_12]
MDSVHSLANWQVLAAIIIALFTFIWIVTGLIHRTYAALGGGLLMVILGIVEAGSAFWYHLPWQAIGLLIGLMIMIGMTNRTGVFSYAAAKAAQGSKGKPIILLIVLALLSTAAAAWLDSLTAILLLIPITISIAKLMKISAVPFVITITITANLGGTATLIGSLPSVIIGTKAGLTFNDFLVNLVPPVLIIWIVTVGLLSLFYAKVWKSTQTPMGELMSIQPGTYIKDKRLVIKVLTVWGLVLAAFMLHPLLRFEVAYVALAGALLMCIANYKKHGWTEIHSSVDWSTLFYICGLFIVVGGVMEAGIVQVIVVKAMELTSGNLMYISMLILWLTGLVSATTDSTFFVTLMIPIIQDLGIQSQGALNPLWWSLALGAGLGGSGTLVGATGNLIAAGLAGRAGHPISFRAFLKAGAPLTLISLLIATAYVSYMFY